MSDPVATLNIQGKKVPVYTYTEMADRNSRSRVPKVLFRAVMGSDDFKAETVEKLHAKLMKASKAASAKIAVPFTIARTGGRWSDEPITLEDGVATGLHASNGNVLGRYGDDESTRQLAFYGGETTMRRLNTDEAQGLLDLNIAYLEAKRAYRGRLEELQIDLAGEVKAAIDAAVGGDES